MPKLFDLVKVNTVTIGTGTVMLGAALSNAFLTPAEAGCVDGDSARYVLVDGTDVEVGEGVIGGSVATMTRTVTFSKISGVKGTSKINLSGTAYLYFTAISSDLLRPATVKKLSGSGTYTSPADSAYVVVQMVGGGGGASGSGTGASMGNGSAGGNTTFDTMTAGGGGAGTNAGGGSPGGGGALTVSLPDVGWAGAPGQGPFTGVAGNFLPRIPGGGSALFNGSCSSAPVAGTGAGGATGQMNGAGNSGGSGGSGASAIGVRAGAGASYSYSVGAGGSGGTAGTGGGAGTAGAAGTILVFEY